MAFDLDEDELEATRELNGVGSMSEEKIVNQMQEFVDWIKANKDKVNKQEELLAILQGMLDLYQQEKEKNKKLEEENKRIQNNYNNSLQAFDIASEVIDMMAEDLVKVPENDYMSDTQLSVAHYININLDKRKEAAKEYYFKKAKEK